MDQRKVRRQLYRALKVCQGNRKAYADCRHINPVPLLMSMAKRTKNRPSMYRVIAEH